MDGKNEAGGIASQPAKVLSPAAQRALEEAAARRAALEAQEAELARQAEIKGRGGKDPVRYADWEVKGIATDF
jgi:hypothetical protein